MIQDADDLPPPPTVPSDMGTFAFNVNAGGQAVGTVKFNLTDDGAVFWEVRSGNVNPSGYYLGTWRHPVGSTPPDIRAFAVGINDQGRIVGRSRSAGGADRAVMRNNYGDSWKDLNDRHFLHGASGWVLRSATAVNNTGYIVGNGTLNGATRDFVLIPRTPGN